MIKFQLQSLIILHVDESTNMTGIDDESFCQHWRIFLDFIFDKIVHCGGLPLPNPGSFPDT